jgi:hypothetical protein
MRGALFSAQVHEEVLRLLLAAVPQLSVERLAQYLHATLANSKRSRKCALLCLSAAALHLDSIIPAFPHLLDRAWH